MEKAGEPRKQAPSSAPKACFRGSHSTPLRGASLGVVSLGWVGDFSAKGCCPFIHTGWAHPWGVLHMLQ